MNKRMKTKIVLAVATLCVAVLAVGCVEHRVEYVPAPQPQAVAITPPENPAVVTEAPPPQQVEVVPVSPGPTYVWVPGYWSVGVGGHWVWIGGRYAVRPHLHAVWVGGRWVTQGHGYVWVAGHWR
jgi:hypothetical protein